MGRTMQVDLQLKVDQAQQQLKQLQKDAQQSFKQSGGNSQAYQQASQAAAQQNVQYKAALANQSALNKALQEEAAHRQKAMQVAQQARQIQLQSREQAIQHAGRAIQGAIPGGNLIGGGAAGTAALVGAAAVTAVIAAVGSELNKLGDRARELASTAGTASSQLGQLRSAIEKSNIRTDINATSPAIVGFEQLKADLSSNLGDLFTHLGNSPNMRSKALNEKLQDGLGQNNENWRRMKEQGVDMEQDIGIARTALDTQTFRQRRDYAIQLRNFDIDTGRQQFDLQKQIQRQQQDYSIQKQKFDENQAGVMAAKQFAISQQFAQKSYQISQSRASQDYSIGRSDKAFDYNLSQSRNQNEFGISQSRNQQEFAINQSRAQTSRKNQLFDMAMGGANGLQFLQASRDFTLQQQYAQQDFQRSKNISTQDFQRNKGYAQQDYGISASRDARNFGISQGRAGQDFGISQQQAQIGRQLELENMLYARKYEGLELELQHNRAVQDASISLERFNQDVARQSQVLQNQGSDMQYDQNLAYSNFNLQTSRQRRNFGYATADFAGQARSNDPLGAAGLGSRDAAFADALARNGQQSGRGDLFKQVNDSVAGSNSSLGAKIGDAGYQASQDTFTELTKWLINFKPFGLDLFGTGKNSGNGTSNQTPVSVNFGGNNPTFQTTAGVSQDDLDRVNQQYQADLQKAMQNVTAELSKLFGG